MSAALTPAVAPLSSQVGGHPGVLTTDDGSLLIKPAHELELQFYQSALTDPRLEPLLPFISRFYGTLKLEGRVAEETGGEGVSLLPMEEAAGEPKESIVLENLCHPFSKPNILDIKLGTILYDPSASPEKRARMEKTARETTSLETGIRLTAFQVYDNKTAEPVSTPKSYGKSIKAADLPAGIARFFPVPGVQSESSLPPHDDASTMSAIAPSSGADLGLPPATLLPILIALREDIAGIRAALETIHLQMVGASLLIVYEADWARAQQGVEQFLVEDSVGRGRKRGRDDDDEEEGIEDEDDDDDEDEEDEEDGPPYVVKLIDFVHTRLVPGEGPDTGVLLGIDTVLRLLDGRIDEVREMVG